jgi:hypothetical protein
MRPRNPERAPVKRRTLVAAIAVLVVILLGAGGAYAYFTSTGSGTGHGRAGTLQAVTVAAVTGTPTTPLLPGSSGDVILNVNNPNAFAVKLVSVTGGPAAITVSGGSGCTLANSGVTFNNQTSLSITIPASNSSFAVDLPGAASMSTSSVSGCQAATFNIPVTITVHKP